MQQTKPVQPAQPNAQSNETPQETAAPRGINGFAIASLVTGLLGIVILGVVFGFVALSQIKQTKQEGRGLAIAGIAISFSYLGLIIAMFIVMFAVLGVFTNTFFNSSFFEVIANTPSNTSNIIVDERESTEGSLLPISFAQDEPIDIDGKELRIEEVERSGETIIITISEKNTSSRPVNYSSDRYVLYSESLEYAQAKETKETVLGKGSLPAGDAISGALVFEVPAAVDPSDLSLQYEPASPAGTFQAVWQLD